MGKGRNRDTSLLLQEKGHPHWGRPDWQEHRGLGGETGHGSRQGSVALQALVLGLVLVWGVVLPVALSVFLIQVWGSIVPDLSSHPKPNQRGPAPPSGPASTACPGLFHRLRLGHPTHRGS